MIYKLYGQVQCLILYECSQPCWIRSNIMWLHVTDTSDTDTSDTDTSDLKVDIFEKTLNFFSTFREN